ncbi:MAG: hypothetical protein JW844_00810 [Candidatus Omnitrophica bacterium]|nr:hypothetical protein [Candidatus Omnitrophota bacterium]
MNLIFVRLFFVMASTVVGYQIGTLLPSATGNFSVHGAIVGFCISGLVMLLESLLKKVSLKGLSAVVFGLIFGLIMAKLLSDAITLLPMPAYLAQSIRIAITLILCYIGMSVTMRGKEEFSLVIPYVRLHRHDQGQDLIILDTSVIIDGRISDICRTKFIDGKFIIPRFVLQELQAIADSSDPIKRNRGRRGLDILNKIQKSTSMDVTISEQDFPDIREVDAKLVKLAKVLSGKIFTNDYNLNKIAELQGIPVLNINDLAESLKPVVLPGEQMTVKPIKEGKEHNQSVAYLEDGTMVVIDEGKDLIGKTIEVVITSVLQTSAGRMIFAKPRNANAR